MPLEVVLPVLSKYKLSINPNALDAWWPIAPSDFILDAPSKLLKAGRFVKNIDIINDWNEDERSVFIQPTITADVEVVSSVKFPVILNYSTTTELLSLCPLATYAPAQSGNNTVIAQFFRASQMFRDI